MQRVQLEAQAPEWNDLIVLVCKEGEDNLDFDLERLVCDIFDWFNVFN